MFALTHISKVRHRFLQPLKTLTESSYANIETPEQNQAPEFPQLLPGVRFSSAAGIVGVMRRVNELELVTRSDISARNAANLSPKRGLEVLRQKRMLSETNKDLAVKKILERGAIRKMLTLSNSNPLDHETA